MSTILTVDEAASDVIRAAREIADSFTSPTGDLIDDNLTRSEWEQLRGAVDRLDQAIGEAATSA